MQGNLLASPNSGNVEIVSKDVLTLLILVDKEKQGGAINVFQQEESGSFAVFSN